MRPALEVPAGHRFETGTLSHEAVAGFVATIEYLESLGGRAHNRRDRLDLAYARIEAHERALTRHTLERLSEVRGLQLYGIADPARVRERTPTFCFNLDGWTPDALSKALADRRLFTYPGNHYALDGRRSGPTLRDAGVAGLKRAGTPGSVRLALAATRSQHAHAGLFGSTAGLEERHFAAIEKRGTPQPYATFTTPLRLTHARPPDVRRAAIFCTEGGITVAAIQKLLEQGDPRAALFADPDWDLRELATGHWAMSSAPEQLAETLRDIAT